MDITGMDENFKPATPHKLDVITVFQVLSGFKNPNHRSGWDGHDLQTGNFSLFRAISYFFQAISGFKILTKWITSF